MSFFESIFSGMNSMFNGGFQSNAFAPQAQQFDQQRQQVKAQSIGATFDVLGNAANRLIQVKNANSYKDFTAYNQRVAYDNSRRLADAQATSNLMVADYASKTYTENAINMQNYAYALQQAAGSQYEQNLKSVSAAAGEAKAGYARSGLQVGTGSAAIVVNNVVKEGIRSSDKQYSDAVSQVNQALNKATQFHLEAAFSKWSAEESNRFLYANLSNRGI